MASNSRTPPAASGTAPASQTEIIDIRVPKNQDKRYGIMRFLESAGVDFTKWVNPKIERENNQTTLKNFNEDMPKFGAGSEYGREAREEARRKKFGVYSRKYKPEDQPWLLQHGGKTGKKYKGVKGGGVTENASYYVFTNAPDGVFEAFPVQDWYNFNPVQSYKALSIEEAEEEFTSRNKTFNLFNVMVRKRMKKNEGDDEEDDDEEGAGKGKGKKKKASKNSRFDNDMDEMMDSSAGESSEGENSDGEQDDEKKKKGKKGKKPVKPKKKRKQNSDDENPLEDSDDGDDEGRECDYISSSSEADSDADTKNELKGVAEEDALRKMLNDESSDEDEEKKDDEEKEEDMDEKEEQAGEGKAPKEEKESKKKKKDKKKSKDASKKPRKEEYGSSSDSDDSSGSELDKAKPSPKVKSASNSRSATPTKTDKLAASLPEPSSDNKRKPVTETPAQPSKKSRMDTPGSSSSASTSSAAAPTPSSGNEGVSEESIRRYLSRKPMTTIELLQKFKGKKTGLSSDQLVSHIAQILKKINPVKQTIKGKMYLSIKG